MRTSNTGRARLADILTISVGAVALFVAVLHLWDRYQITQSPRVRPQEPDRIVSGWDTLQLKGNRIGPADAAVVLMEFGDYECPFCRRAEGPLRALRKAFPDELAIMYRYFPLSAHPNAYQAARLAECAAEQDRFVQAHALLNEAVSLANLDPDRVARELQTPDTSRYVDCATNPDPVRQVEEDRKSAEALDVHRTPTFILDGTLLGTSPDSAEWVELVRERLAAGSQSGSQ